ncbi:hypothetical protein K488DRAFT_9215, partial [Vararia minispora EC-137]
WIPPGPDFSLSIPGEPVLALWKKKRNEWWPARIEEYLPPLTKSDSPNYRITYMDGSVGDVSRDQFYTWLEPEFHTYYRVPAFPAPSPDDFVMLPLRHQLAYIFPILRAVLANRYSPCKSRHDQFMQGGAKRAALRREGSSIGNMTTTTAQAFGNLVYCWAAG